MFFTRETAKQAKEVLSVYLNSLENIDEWAEESNEIKGELKCPKCDGMMGINFERLIMWD